jgi:hypothetical protein
MFAFSIRPVLFAATISIVLFSSACSGDKGTREIVDSIGKDSNQVELDKTRLKLQRLLNSIPVPFKTLEQLTGAGLPFRQELLNPEMNAGNYSQAQEQALNLGIYGADLAYLISQEKFAESAPYLRRVKQLADAVVVPSAFDERMVRQFTNNMPIGEKPENQKRDTLQKLVYDSYDRIDSSLQSNERLELATLVVAGGWIESLYLATQHLGDERPDKNNQVLWDILKQQRKQLPNLIALVADFEENPNLKLLHDDLVSIRDTYPEKANLNAEQQKTLRESVARLRNRCIGK